MIPIRVMNREQAIRYSYSNHPKTLMISIRDNGSRIPHFVKEILLSSILSLMMLKKGIREEFLLVIIKLGILR